MVFGPTDAGVTKSIANLGLDTCWQSFDNMQRGLLYMGTNNVTVVRVGFTVDAQLVNNDISSSDKASLQNCLNYANMATAATKWDLNLDSSVDPWYQSGVNTVYPDRWAAAMEACQRFYNHSFWSAEGFNEPDYTVNNEGSPQNLYDIFGYLQTSGNFNGTIMAGGSPLNDDVAQSWFNAITPRATMGTTHCLAGSASSYVNFIQTVNASGALAFNPEMHNVVEAIMGANYGMNSGIWWGTAELARGNFVQASQGKRLAYAEDLNNWTAAAIYRAPNGSVQAFVGASERMATTTTYRFFSKDRRVFFDGNGPQRDYAVTIPGGTGYQQNQPNAERVVNITWGADVPPAISGRYIIVNLKSGLVLEVPGNSRSNGTQLDQAAYTGAKNQQWDIYQLASTSGGDFSYYTMANVNSGDLADLYASSYANGGVIDQWSGNGGANQNWYFQYVGNGYFKIHNRWSANKLLCVLGSSTSAGAQIVQWDDTGTLDQQWRLVPASAGSYDFVAPAAPTGVSATANAVSVTLNWNANAESDLAGYTVLRSTTSGGPYDIVARGLATNSFTDGSVNPGQRYYYVVAAADKSLNQSAYSSQVSATPVGGQAMLANYNFENNSTDSSGNGNDAELVGSPGYSTGQSGSALSLNGSGQSAVLPAGILNGATNFTFASWVYWNGGNAWQYIFEFGNDTNSYMDLTPNSAAGTLRFAVTTNSWPNNAEQFVETSVLPTKQWVHVAVTYDGTTASLYVNGALAASGPVSISPAAFNPMANFIGQSLYTSDPYFNGKFDGVYLFNYALTATQIANLANGTPPNNGPAAPTGLGATGGNQVVNLAWTQSAGSGITGNNVYRSTTGSGGPYSLLASLGAATTYSDSAVTGGNTYYYTVTAVNNGGESAMSAYAGATPTGGTTAPVAPTNLSASSPHKKQIALSWTQSASPNITSNKIYRGTANGGPYSLVATVSATTSYSDTGLNSGTTYYYVVTAVNSSSLESPNSNQSSAKAQ